MKNSNLRTNDNIEAAEVRLVSSDGEQIGIKTLSEALVYASQQNLDLVEVAPASRPPVCRIMNYSKHRYEVAQRAKESRRKSSHSVLKEMKYRPNIGRGDFKTKTAKVVKFLKESHKVKITIEFKGREISHPELGKETLERIADTIVDIGKVDKFPKLNGRNMTMLLSPGADTSAKQDVYPG